MRLPGRGPAPPAGDGPATVDAEQQAAWDADGAGPYRRRQAVLALGLVALLVVAVLVVARARGDGDILALGSSPKSSTIPPLANDDTITGDPLFEGSQVIAPGDPALFGPGGSQQAAAGAADPAAAAAAAQQAAAAVGGVSGGTTGAAGGGIPIPTTRPGSGGGGGSTPTTTGGAGTTTTTIPGQPPPPPTCRVTDAVAIPSGASLKGQSGKLDDNSTRVEFRQTSCGSSFRVELNGKEVTASNNGGLFVATIPTTQTNWKVRNYPISIRNEATTIATIFFNVSP